MQLNLSAVQAAISLKFTAVHADDEGAAIVFDLCSAFGTLIRVRNRIRMKASDQGSLWMI